MNRVAIDQLHQSESSARPHRRGVYLLAGLLGTQVLYLVGLMTALALAKLTPHLFVSALTVNLTLTTKLPIAVIAIGLTLYPPVVSLLARWLRQRQSGLPGLFTN